MTARPSSATPLHGFSGEDDPRRERRREALLSLLRRRVSRGMWIWPPRKILEITNPHSPQVREVDLGHTRRLLTSRHPLLSEPKRIGISRSYSAMGLPLLYLTVQRSRRQPLHPPCVSSPSEGSPRCAYPAVPDTTPWPDDQLV